jgi:hypothetical protein
LAASATLSTSAKKDHVNQVAVILETHELPVVRDLTRRREEVSQL